MSRFFFVVVRVARVALGTLILLITSWIGYGTYLTNQVDCVCGAPVSTMLPKDLAINSGALQRVLDHYSAQKGNVGLQATVILADGTTWIGVAGYVSQRSACSLTLDYSLYIGSMTKLYTSALVMAQVEQGMPALDDTLDTWFDMPYAHVVTVEMLLNHTSGISNYTENTGFLVLYLGLPQKQWRADELLAVFRRRPLDFEPGTRHEYSNSNYILLGIILEKITGHAYADLLCDMTTRLGVMDTVYLSRGDDWLIANGYDETLLPLGRKNITGLRCSLGT